MIATQLESRVNIAMRLVEAIGEDPSNLTPKERAAYFVSLEILRNYVAGEMTPEQHGADAWHPIPLGEHTHVLAEKEKPLRLVGVESDPNGLACVVENGERKHVTRGMGLWLPVPALPE